jgi:hypothetical protein
MLRDGPISEATGGVCQMGIRSHEHLSLALAVRDEQPRCSRAMVEGRGRRITLRAARQVEALVGQRKSTKHR